MDYVKRMTTMKIINLVTDNSESKFEKNKCDNFKRHIKHLSCGEVTQLPGGIKARLFYDPFDETIEPELRIKAPSKPALFFSFKNKKTINLLDHAGYVISLVAYSRENGLLHSMWFEFSHPEAEISKCRRG